MPGNLLPEGCLAQPGWEMALELPGVCVHLCKCTNTCVHIYMEVKGQPWILLSKLLPFAYFFYLFERGSLCGTWGSLIQLLVSPKDHLSLPLHNLDYKDTPLHTFYGGSRG